MRFTVFDPDAAAMAVDNGARNSQSQPHPALFGAKERIKYFWKVFDRNAMTVVTHGNHDSGRRGLPHRNFNEAPIFWKISDCVQRVQRKIDEHLLKLCLIAINDGLR